MCQIIIKEFGKKLPPVEMIVKTKETIIDGRGKDVGCDDGYSIAWCSRRCEGVKGELNTFRTVDFDQFLRVYGYVSDLSIDDTACIVHLRDGSSGSKDDPRLCHCWNYDELCFAMNGTLTDKALGKATMSSADKSLLEQTSDSWYFFYKMFVPAFVEGEWEEAEKQIIRCRENKYGTECGNPAENRFAFIDSDGVIRKYGEFCSYRGCYYSNRKILDCLKINGYNAKLYFGLRISDMMRTCAGEAGLAM